MNNKTNMKRKLILCAIALLSLTAGAQKKWTLKDCIDYAMQNNISLKQSRLSKQSATEDRKQSQAALLPSLSASTNQGITYRPWLNSGSTGVEIDKATYSGTYGINAHWTVWNGNQNRNQVKLNKLMEEQAELQSEQTANSIQERIAQLYVQILYMSESIGVYQQTLETSKKNEERGQQMVEVGKMSKADLAQLSAQRATDEYNVVEAQGQLASYKLQLKQLLELTDDQPFDIAIPEISDDEVLAEVPALNSVYEQALLSRPEIEASQLAIKRSDVSLAIAKAGWMPTLSMTGGIGTSSNSLNSNSWGKQIKTSFDATAGLSLSIPIYDGRQTKTQVNKAKIQQLSARLSLLDEQKTLYSDIQRFWLNAQTNQQKYQAAKASVASEQESFDLLQEQFRLGLKNIVELMTGKDKLLSAQQSMLQSKYTALYNEQMLRFYQGQEIKIGY